MTEWGIQSHCDTLEDLIAIDNGRASGAVPEGSGFEPWSGHFSCCNTKAVLLLNGAAPQRDLIRC